MLYTKLLGARAAMGGRAGRGLVPWATLRHCCADHPSVHPQPRNYALPNATWTSNTRGLHDRFMRDSATWWPVPSYDSNHHYNPGKAVKPGSKGRRFTRSLDEDGVGFEYCLFYNQAEKRMVCVFQPGPFLEGYSGYVHGGCIATIIDTALGKLAIHTCGRIMTANLNINFRNPVALGATVLIDGRVDKAEGRKVFTSCEVRSHDDAVLHAEATGLFIKANSTESEAGGYSFNSSSVSQ